MLRRWLQADFWIHSIFQKTSSEPHSRGATGASLLDHSGPINAEIQNAEMSDLLDAPTQDNDDNDYWDEFEPETITERIALFLATLNPLVSL